MLTERADLWLARSVTVVLGAAQLPANTKSTSFTSPAFTVTF
jgi:hypothetical protein